ncbi:MAG: membrane-bound PQQ-dependent dehydrogenase, glucose/quinate/shikimate family, partial [Brevundimonas sp.]|nr:membrane-bound PQQ-dependent dehydrogenase, glucose/quinate/shikimate family [Brevundimonas sp.]
MFDRLALARWPLVTLGAVFILVGLPLVIGGVWLLALGGSFYYLPAGLALVVSGALLAVGRPLGAWIYTGLYVLTLLWALWEVGLNGWALVPRVVAPTILMAAL